MWDTKTGERLNSGTVIRPHSPAGIYWKENFSTPDGLYFNAGDLVFSACHFNKDAVADFYSEFDQPCLEELRLIATLTLPIGPACGVIRMYPLLNSVVIGERCDLADSNIGQQLAQLLRNDFEFDRTHLWERALVPSFFGGAAYSFREQRVSKELLLRIYGKIDPSDHLLMRGIGAFIEAEMFLVHRELSKGAHYSIYIALDASFELVRRRLRQSGISNPTAFDAAKSIEEAFGEDPNGGRYFSDYYDDRIRALHASNRFGTAPYMPLGHSDYFQLYYSLREVYRWLILGEHVPLG